MNRNCLQIWDCLCSSLLCNSLIMLNNLLPHFYNIAPFIDLQGKTPNNPFPVLCDGLTCYLALQCSALICGVNSYHMAGQLIAPEWKVYGVISKVFICLCLLLITGELMGMSVQWREAEERGTSEMFIHVVSLIFGEAPPSLIDSSWGEWNVLW